jgi:hypothetical protein
MLQARTYLFCAIRPEVKFHQYTFSTLGFAKNASVIKLSPKKATNAASPREAKLMQELEQMKTLVAELRKSGGGGEGDAAKDEQIQALMTQLASKQAAMAAEMSGGGNAANDERVEKQKAEYGRRGISLAEFTKVPTCPYFVNIDVDEFRSKRFYYLLEKPSTTFGTDIKPMDFGITKDHCVVSVGAENATVLVNGSGQTFHNGKAVAKGDKIDLAHNDRVVLSNEMMLFKMPGSEGDEMSPEDIAREFSEARMANNDSAEMRKLAEEKAKWEEEKRKMEAAMAEMKKKSESGDAKAAAEAEAMKKQLQAEQAKQAEAQNRSMMLELIPQVDEATKMLDVLNRSMLECEAMLRVGLSEDGSFQTPSVKVKIVNRQTDDIIYIDPYEFKQVHDTMRAEVGFLNAHLEDGEPYEASKQHDPIEMFYNITYELGAAVLFNEQLLYMLPTDDEDKMVEIKNVGDPHGKYGQIECIWTPLAEDMESEYPEDDIVEDPQELLGKSWTFKFEIIGITHLPVIADVCYCQYKFNGQTFTTETIERTSDHPTFNYSCVHRVDNVTQEFIDEMQTKSMMVQVFVSPYISDPPHDKLSTSNKIIAKKLGYDAGVDPSVELKKQVEAQKKEIEQLQAIIKEKLGAQADVLIAKAKDAALNG